VSDQSGKNILTINIGSSSLKAGLYGTGRADLPEALLSARASRIGLDDSHMLIAGKNGTAMLDRKIGMADHSTAIEALVSWLKEHNLYRQIGAVGHRIVHGGRRFSEPQLITPELMSALREVKAIDPDHIPQELIGVELAARLFPAAQQVACFDTAFHRGMPKVAQTYALPRNLYDQGVMRYGFHGLSYEYTVEQLRCLDGELAEGRVVVAHLGNGASMAAISRGKSIDTSMGFTPVEGLVMGTRSGDLDPGAVLHLIGPMKISPQAVRELINKQAGLLGVSGISEDMRDLLEKETTDPRAAEAIELFCYRAKKYISAYAAVLGGLDILVFTGGIGESAASIRERICSGLDFLGIRIDQSRNEAHSLLISSDSAPVRVRVIKTDEDLMIAKHTVSVAYEGGDSSQK
jgi:acetate kinase